MKKDPNSPDSLSRQTFRLVSPPPPRDDTAVGSGAPDKRIEMEGGIVDQFHTSELTACQSFQDGGWESREFGEKKEKRGKEERNKNPAEFISIHMSPASRPAHMLLVYTDERKNPPPLHAPQIFWTAITRLRLSLL